MHSGIVLSTKDICNAYDIIPTQLCKVGIEHFHPNPTSNGFISQICPNFDFANAIHKFLNIQVPIFEYSNIQVPSA